MKAQASSGAPFTLAPLLRLSGTLGKDLVRYGGVALLIALVILIVRYAAILLSNYGILKLHLLPGINTAASAYFTMLLISGAAIGLSSSTEEEEAGTRQFLDSMPISRLKLAAQKLLAGILTLAVSAVIFAPVFANLQADAVRDLLTREHGQSFLFPVQQNPAGALIGGVAFLATGLAMGTLFGNLLAGGVATILLAGLYFSLSALFVRPRETPMLDPDGKIYVAAIVWIFLMLGLYARAFKAARERVDGGISDTWKVIVALFVPKRAHAKLDPFALVRLVRVTAVLCSLAVALPAVMLWQPFSEIPTPLLSIFGSGVLLGLFAWNQIERDQMNSVVFTLPIPRGRFYLARISTLSLHAFALGCVVFLGHIPFLHFDWKSEQMPLLAVLWILMLVAITISGALLSSLFRLFTRLRLVAFALSFSVHIAWAVTATFCSAVVGQTYGLFSFESYAYWIWAGLIAVFLPMLAGGIAYARSPLLELPESRRGWPVLALFLVLLVWGVFLIGLSPIHLLRL